MGRTAAWLLTLLFAHANAATFTVTNLNDSGPGSLRQAVIDANGDTVSDTINFAVTGTIVLTSGGIPIYTPMTISGPGASSLTIDGNQSFRIFSIVENVADACATPGSDYLVTISGVTLARGWRTTDNTGGAIYAEKSLTLDSVVVSNNEARAGGGLSWQVNYSGQALTIRNSTFSGNLAREFPSTTSGPRGGAMRTGNRCPTPVSSASVTIVDSDFLDNHARPVSFTDSAAGGLELQGPLNILISNSRISGNTIDVPPSPPAGANFRGGGIRIVRAISATIERTEISDNSANRQGGLAVVNEDAAKQTAEGVILFRLINSTISGNSAIGANDARAGGLQVVGNVDALIFNSTITNNSTLSESGGIRLGTDFVSPATEPPSLALPPTLLMRSALVSGNSVDDLSLDNAAIPTLNADVSQSLLGVVGSGVTLTGSGNILGLPPLLGALAFNGGATRTHALQTGSPAINTGSDVLGLLTDQRGPGFPRTIGPATDIGAYEYRAPRVVAAATPVPTLSQYALAALSLLTAIAGFAALRRRA